MDFSKEDIRKAILDIVRNSNGIKNVDLALKVLERSIPYLFESHLYGDCIQELVDEGEIMEIEYVLPHMDYRTKSMYFPKGTKVIAA